MVENSSYDLGFVKTESLRRVLRFAQWKIAELKFMTTENGIQFIGMSPEGTYLNAKSLIVSGANILSEFSYKIKISFIRNKCDGIGEQRLENIGGNYNRGCLIDALIPDTDVRIAFVGANNPIFLRYVLKNGTYASIAIAARLYKEEFKKHEDLVPKPSQRLEVEI